MAAAPTAVPPSPTCTADGRMVCAPAGAPQNRTDAAKKDLRMRAIIEKYRSCATDHATKRPGARVRKPGLTRSLGGMENTDAPQPLLKLSTSGVGAVNRSGGSW